MFSPHRHLGLIVRVFWAFNTVCQCVIFIFIVSFVSCASYWLSATFVSYLAVKKTFNMVSVHFCTWYIYIYIYIYVYIYIYIYYDVVINTINTYFMIKAYINVNFVYVQNLILEKPVIFNDYFFVLRNFLVKIV